jgi:hypothetical protein
LTLWELEARCGQGELEAASWCAKGWTRELDQDPPFNARSRVDWDAYSLWLWTLPGGMSWRFTVVGGCAFARDIGISHDPFWTLHWLWIHPFSRHRGVWAESFAVFVQRFHLLQIHPLTSAMQRFLAGRPTHPVRGSAGEMLQLFAREPGCKKGHGPMVEHTPGLWLCGARLGDDICREKWAAPALLRSASSAASTR